MAVNKDIDWADSIEALANAGRFAGTEQTERESRPPEGTKQADLDSTLPAIDRPGRKPRTYNTPAGSRRARSILHRMDKELDNTSLTVQERMELFRLAVKQTAIIANLEGKRPGKARRADNASKTKQTKNAVW
jgi:hypothetical protein